MGRSRVVHSSSAADDDPNQRTKRRRVPNSGENLETLSTGQGTNDGKRALYHCNYCNKDISGKIRIKCAKCPDFDLCVECFSVGAEVTPHKSIHHYRVMDSLSFPLISPDWYADEEILLLEGIEMYGLGNWAEVAEHVGTKSKAQCIDHYTTAYLNSPCYPLPDMSHVVGKNRKELLAMAKVGELKKGFLGAGEITPKEDSPFSPSRVKIEEPPTLRSPSSLTADGDSGESKMSGVGCSSTNMASAGAGKKVSNMVQFKDGPDGIKVEGVTSAEDTQVDRSVGGKKPKYTGDEGPSMTELSGYNPKRQEFDPEYDNDAEQMLAEMEFKDTDPEAERELKLRVLRIYSSRLDERKRRKDFVLERNLLYPNPIEKDLSGEEREIYNHCKVFMRFHSQEEHEALVKGLIEEHRLRKKIQELQEARSAGCRTRAEAEVFLAQKKKRDAEASARKAKETGQPVGNGKVLQKANRLVKGESEGSPRSTIDNHKMKGSTGLESGGKDSSSTTTGAITKSLDEWDITGLPGADLLSETEQQLCCQNRLLPSHYLKILEVLSLQTLNGNISKRSDAYRFFKVDPVKVDRVYDMAIKKGLVPRDEAPIV
ncbi:transcriptional adapter ADA2 isoform X2 [Magnolia sinica]|uniref:transcriptional adapter ADA2 isoform X2 n=1 Tax=Magnolia sinica TaxID=86752 RepID=UPI00265990D6|nr:transcriptional adapter ADA2 isoform X2 [Magnolia sinica]